MLVINFLYKEMHKRNKDRQKNILQNQHQNIVIMKLFNNFMPYFEKKTLQRVEMYFKINYYNKKPFLIQTLQILSYENNFLYNKNDYIIIKM